MDIQETAGIVGREPELAILESLYDSAEPEFLAMYGRRRVGKTYLLNRFYAQKGIYFELTGVKRATPSQQLQNFKHAYSETFLQGEPAPEIESWLDAFHALVDVVKSYQSEKKIVLFFDELPWLASKRSGFLGALEHAWNRYLSRQPNILLIVCGSAASWMVRKVIHNKGGLYGRLTRVMKLEPFTLRETKKYLRARSVELDDMQLLELYMAFGGIAKYLSYMKPNRSSAQLIGDLCLTENAPLLSEFKLLYHALFDSAEIHIKLIALLSKHFYGLEQRRLLELAGRTSGGSSSHYLEELVEAGFVVTIPAISHGRARNLYRLWDPYSLFYLTWLEGKVSRSFGEMDKDYWLKQSRSAAWRSWSGLAFEAVCMQHVSMIKEALGISGVLTTQMLWRDAHAQIDLIIERDDNCIHLCEIKYAKSEYVLTKNEAEKILKRKELYMRTLKKPKTVFVTLITPNGAVENAQYTRVVNMQVKFLSLLAD